MPTNNENRPLTPEEEQEDWMRKAARMREAAEAGCLTREIANMPDGGRSILGEATWEKLKDYAKVRSNRRG